MLIQSKKDNQSAEKTDYAHLLKIPIILVLAALLYNAFLAVANAHIMNIGKAHVAAAEIGIICATIAWAFLRDPERNKPWMIYLGIVVAIFIGTYLLTLLLGNQTGLKPLRDLLIICAFGMLGASIQGQYQYATRIFVVLSLCVVTFLLLENYAVGWFVKIFEITDYYMNTRTMTYDMLRRADQADGLFFTASSFEGRFTLGFRTDQRLSSVFLEPTTHGNFGVLVLIFLMTFWQKLRPSLRILFASTAILIVLGTDSRQLIAMMGLLILFKMIGIHKAPRASLLAYIPFTLLIMTVFFYDPGAVKTDDFSGRLTYSINKFLSIPFSAWLGGQQGIPIVDSGYTYVVYAHSFIGALLFWLVLAFMPGYSTKEQRYFAHAIMLFFTVNLAVSGSTIFSIKTAALLWFMVGLLRYQTQDDTIKFPNLMRRKKADA